MFTQGFSNILTIGELLGKSMSSSKMVQYLQWTIYLPLKHILHTWQQCISLC